MTVIELPTCRLARRTLFEDLLLYAARSASSLVERRLARRSTAAGRRGHDAVASRAATAGAHALGLLPR